MKGCVDPWLNQHNSSPSHPSMDYKRKSPPHFKNTPFSHISISSQRSQRFFNFISLDFEGVSSFIP
ncbi:hypothetical protein LINPERHAP1_LOCUS21975 [Linum perenne]